MQRSGRGSCTGMRKGELFGLKREHVNFSPIAVTHIIKGEVWEVRPSWLLIEKSKNGRPRVIPMSQRVRGILQTLCDDVTIGEYVFRSIRTGERINDMKKGFVSACQEAGIKNFIFHDFRHTWTSRAAEMSVPEHVRRDILGHSPKCMTGSYTHASPEEMERAMELVASFSGQNISGLGKISANQETAMVSHSTVAS